MISEDNLVILTDYDVHRLLRHYLELAGYLEQCIPDYKLIDSLKPDISRLFTRIPESTSRRYCIENQFVKVPCKVIGETFYYYEDGEVYSDSTYLFSLDPWTAEDPDVLKSVNTTLLEIIDKRSESVESASNKAVKQAKHRFQGILNRRKFAFIKYQISRYLNTKFHVPKKFMIKGKTLYENAEILEQTLLNGKITDKSFRALNDSFGSQTYQDLRSWLHDLFGYRLIKYDGLANPSPVHLAIHMANEEQLQQMLEVQDVVFRPESKTSHYDYMFPRHLYEQRYFSTVPKPTLIDTEDICSYDYRNGSVLDLIEFVKIAEGLYNEPKVPEDLKDFLVTMGLVKKKEEDTVEG